MTVDNTKLVLNSADKIDQIINVLSGSFTANASTNNGTGPVISTNIADTTFFAGVFKRDASADYQNLGSWNAVAFSGVNQFGLAGVSTSGSLSLKYWNSDTNPHTYNYQVALIAKPTTGLVTVQNVGTKTYLNTSKYNYQKVAVDKTQPITVAGGGSAGTPIVTTISVAHDLGYFPTVRAFLDNGTSLTDILFFDATLMLGNSGITVFPRIDTANVYFDFSNSNAGAFNYNLSTRVYYDPS